MKRTLLTVLILMTVSLGYSRTWQTWDAKGYLVENFKDPAPADDNQGNAWYTVDYDASEWNDITGPVESFTERGAYYVRRTVNIENADNGFEFVLYVDYDDVAEYYFNGHPIGQLGDHRIVIPQSYIHSGDNLIAAVVYDNGGGNQYSRINLEQEFTLAIDGFVYKYEDGIVSVSTQDNYDYADDTRFREEITFNGVTYDVTLIKNLSHLRNVYIPESINKIEEYGRWGSLGVGNIQSVAVSENSQFFIVEDSVLYDKDKTVLIWGANKKNVIVPEGVVRISPYSFFGCDQLESIILPSTLKEDLHRVFDGCSNLKSLNIPTGVTGLTYFCLSGCTSLESIYFNTSMPFDAEASATGVSADRNSCILYVPVGSLDLYKDFKIWSEFTNIVEDPNLIQTDISNIHNGYLYELEDGVVKVSDLNLNYDDSRHYILDNVTIDGQNYPVYTLKTISHKRQFCIPAFITSFEYGRWGTFDTYYTDDYVITVDENNNYFTEIDGIIYTKDLSQVLWAASKQEIIIPEGVKSIASYAFWAMPQLEHITLPSTLEGSIHRLFEGCTNLQELVIPEGVTSVEYLLCNGCSNLSKVILPQSLKLLGLEAFQGCTSLTSITIPSNVNAIQEDAFNGCTNLREIICMVAEPLPISEDVFKNVDTDSTILYVPCGSKSLYENALIWKEFKNIVESPFFTTNIRLGHIVNTTLPVYLNNPIDVGNIQFDLVLPEGISIAKKQGSDEYDITLGTERFEGLDHTITTRILDDGSIRVICTSPTNTNIRNDIEGSDLRTTKPLLYFKLEINAKPGTYAFMLYDVVMSNFSNNYVERLAYDKAFFTFDVAASSPISAVPNNPLFGTVSIAGDEYDSNYGVATNGSLVTLTAQANEGYGFVNWVQENISLSNNTQYSFTIEQETSITANFTLIGDVYEDGFIDVADLTATVALILSQDECSRRDFVAANVYEDEDIDVADYSSIVNMILYRAPITRAPIKSVLQTSAADSDKPCIFIDERQAILNESSISLPISMLNDKWQIVSLQFDLECVGMNSSDFTTEIKNIISKTDRIADHTVSASIIADNTLRIVVTSSINKTINGNEGNLLSLNASNIPFDDSSIDINIKNVVLFTDNNVKVVLPSSSFNILMNPTKVNTINNSTNNDLYYDLNGIKHQSMQKGFNIINGKVIFNLSE